MLEYGFNFDLTALIAGALKVLLIIVVVLVVLAILRRAIPRLVASRVHKVREESPEELSKRTDTLSGVLVQIIAFIVWLVAFVMILGVFGVDTTPLIAAIGVAGLALGFAAQNIVRDYLNGFFIIMEDWYRIDEVVTVAGITGAVVDFNLRRTTLRDLDGTMHVIPNNKVDLASNRAREWARINLNITVAYKENLSHVWQLVDAICQELRSDPAWGQHMISTPEVVRVDNLGDHGVELKILGDTKAGQQWALMGELRKRIKERFDQEGIEIPWPHTKVYFGNSPGG